MLPPTFLTIPQIEREQRAGSKLMHLTALLEYLLRLCNPNLLNDAGREPSLGERINAFKHLFDKIDQVFWAVKVRNAFVHGLEGSTYSDRDARNAVNYLIEAIGVVCAQSAIPRPLVAAIYDDPDVEAQAQKEADARRQQEQKARAERERKAQAEQAQQVRAQEIRLEEVKLLHARREKEAQERKARWQTVVSGLRKLLVLAVLGGALWWAWPTLMTLYKGDRGGAAVVRTAAELALKKVRGKQQQREYAEFINQADAAWRDAEIEFKRGNFRAAEERYRQVIGFWDALNARMAESSTFEELLAEVNTLRRAATDAQAPQKAAEQWRQAEDFRRNAVTARKNGDLAGAKNLIVQARQLYEAAQATALTPAPEPSQQPTPAPDQPPHADEKATEPTPPATPEPARPEPILSERPRIRPREPAIATEQQDDDDPFTISGKEFMQYVTKRVNPILPPQAKQVGVSGSVVVTVYLSKSGHLTKAEVVQGDPLLREAALTALRQWSFRPFLLDRTPTDIKSEISIQVR
ncbi:MAG: TonB family protein [Acidobacteria bacterium]|nr:TonB family protein [Acidobacteriota bacterium]